MTESLQAQFAALENLGSTPGTDTAQERGRKFEALVLGLLAANTLLLRRSYHTSDNKSEQIDGAIKLGERVVLVETKWVEAGIAASELYAFVGKVECKFAGTIGLFISRVALSGNFLGGLRNGRRQSVLVVHGDDVPAIFTPKFPLDDYLRASLHKVSLDNVVHLSVADFLRAEMLAKPESQTGAQGLVDKLASTDVAKIPALVVGTDDKEIVANTLNLLRAFTQLLVNSSGNRAIVAIPVYVAAATKRLGDQPTAADQFVFSDLLPAALGSADYDPIIAAFAPRLRVLDDPSRKSAENELVKRWEDALGDFAQENLLADPTRFLWQYLSTAAREMLMAFFVSIVNSSSRQAGYPQIELATELISDKSNSEALRGELVKRMRLEFNENKNSGLDLSDPEAWKWVEGSYSRIRRLAPEVFVESAHAARE